MNVHILASTSVPFTLTTVQVPNLSLTHTKRITVCVADSKIITKKLGGFIDRHNPQPSYSCYYRLALHSSQAIHIKQAALRNQSEDFSCAPTI